MTASQSTQASAPRLFVLHGQTHDPYHNLAVEAHLLTLTRNEVILYLWQNDHTVVIGHNQNALREVNLAKLRRDGGHLARRLSGGGAVYHDLGNLNFTFVAPRELYSLPRQTRVLLEAARLVGVNALSTGRNDITVEGRKFSGNAFYRRGDTWYHHGTLLVSSNLRALSGYLNVSPQKLLARGVASVRGRVCNLTEYVPELTVDGMRRAVTYAFGRVYGGEPQPFDLARLNYAEVARIQAEISSQAYLLGEKSPLDCCLERRFDWGEVQLAVSVRGGCIAACHVHSDAMDEAAMDALPARLLGCAVEEGAFHDALRGWADETMARDVVEMLMTL